MSNELLIKLLKKRLHLHIVFWVVFALAFSMGWLGAGHSWRYILINYVGTLLIYIAFVNATLYLAYQYFVPAKKYLLAFITFVVLLLGSTYANAFLYRFSGGTDSTVTFQNFIAFYIFLAAFTLALKIARTAYLNLAAEIAIKQDLLNQKDYFLRSQIHPHFLFNTLNNFYGLALAKSDKLPGLMLHLSNILRHQIYNSETSYVQLQKEIDYIKDYIELEKIRHGDNLSFNFSFPAEAVANKFVMPFVLIVFFENAFKHSGNVSSQLIEISGALKVEGDTMKFDLVNTYPESTFVKYKEESGMGLENVKRRLALMGENNYRLEVKKENGRFAVALTMKLKEQ